MMSGRISNEDAQPTSLSILFNLRWACWRWNVPRLENIAVWID